MAIVFKFTGEQAVFNMKDFCRLKRELTYVGEFAHKATCVVISGSIIKYKNKYYTTELTGRAGISCTTRGNKKTTSVELFEATEYVPEECRPVSDCPIRIDVWALKVDDEAPISRYACDESQLGIAKNIVKRNPDVDIYFKGKEISREEFLAK